MTPNSLGRFKIISVLGRGATGCVYLAHDPTIDRRVAIKTLEGLAALSESERAMTRVRFLREAQAAGRLSHPNIVTIFDVGEDGETPYIAMEFLDGRNLAAHTAPPDLLPLTDIVMLMEQACDALDYAHASGIVHRDIKPANMMVLPGGTLKIADFGLAKRPETSLTTEGNLVGTPYYMSPEQIRGAAIDGRSDLFSLGVVLQQLVAGALPFPGDSIHTVIHRILSEPPSVPEQARAVPRKVRDVILKALEKDPARRHATGGEFRRALREAALEEAVDAALDSAAAGAVATRQSGHASQEAHEVAVASGPPIHRTAHAVARGTAAPGSPVAHDLGAGPLSGSGSGRSSADATSQSRGLEPAGSSAGTDRPGPVSRERVAATGGTDRPGFRVPSEAASETGGGQHGGPHPGGRPESARNPIVQFAGELAHAESVHPAARSGPFVLRPRRGRKLLGAATVLAVLLVVGAAAFYVLEISRPGLLRPGSAASTVAQPPPELADAGTIIRVVTDRSASLSLDGKPLSGPTFRLVKGDMARHVLRAESGCKAAEKEFSAAAGTAAEIRLDLVPERVRIPVASTPPGAKVKLDGAQVPGATPLTIEIDRCAATRVELALGGYLTLEYRRKAGDPAAPLAAALASVAFKTQEPGTLRVAKGPYDGQVFVDGRRVGQAGGSFQVAPGSRRVALVSDPLFVHFEQTVQMTAGGELLWKPTWPSLGAITVQATPTNCSIEVRSKNGSSFHYLDDVPIVRYRLATGAYMVRATLRASGKTQVRNVEVLPGTTVQIDFTFL